MSNFSPRKHLGQHFLVDEQCLHKITESCALLDGESVLEVGPGQGALTRFLLARGARVHAVEADVDLITYLSENFNDQALRLYNSDILKFDLSMLPADMFPLKIIGNLPYNISTPILEKILNSRRHIRSVYITVQYEFGVRLMASAGSKDYSSLSCLVNMFARPAMLFRMNNKVFRPMPKVESCFMRLDILPEPAYAVFDIDFFCRIVRLAFLQRRKTIVNALSTVCEKNLLLTALESLDINPNLRPEMISSAHFAGIANFLVKALRK